LLIVGLQNGTFGIFNLKHDSMFLANKNDKIVDDNNKLNNLDENKDEDII